MWSFICDEVPNIRWAARTSQVLADMFWQVDSLCLRRSFSYYSLAEVAEEVR